MIKLRLKRYGKKFVPHYRIIAIKGRTKRQGRAIEYVGYYSPITKEVKLEKERIEHWLKVGAQPTPSVENILIKEKLLPEKKYKKTYKKNPKGKAEKRMKEEKKEEKPAEKKPAILSEATPEKPEETPEQVTDQKKENDKTTEK